jgi:hypothetical protein
MREIAELQAKINLLLALSSWGDAELIHKDQKISLIASELTSKENELARLDSQLTQKNEELKRKDEELKQKDEELKRNGQEYARASTEMAAQMRSLELQNLEVNVNVQAVLNSTSWRITAPLRWLGRKTRQ